MARFTSGTLTNSSGRYLGYTRHILNPWIGSFTILTTLFDGSEDPAEQEVAAVYKNPQAHKGNVSRVLLRWFWCIWIIFLEMRLIFFPVCWKNLEGLGIGVQYFESKYFSLGRRGRRVACMGLDYSVCGLYFPISQGTWRFLKLFINLGLFQNNDSLILKLSFYVQSTFDGEISYVSWNRKVQPIVASTSYSGTSGQLIQPHGDYVQ